MIWNKYTEYRFKDDWMHKKDDWQETQPKSEFNGSHIPNGRAVINEMTVNRKGINVRFLSQALLNAQVTACLNKKTNHSTTSTHHISIAQM